MGKLNIKKILLNEKIKKFTIYGVGQAVNIVSPLLITPYLVYTCGIEKLGLVAIGQSIAYILIVVVDYSSYIQGVKEVSINRNDDKAIEKLFLTIYSAKLFLLAVVFIFITAFIFFIPYLSSLGILIFLSMSIVMGQFINPTWFFQGIENFKWITIINIISKIIYLGGTFLFITEKEEYIYANLWLGVGAIIANSIGVFWILRKYQISFKKISVSGVKKLLEKDFLFCISQLFFSIRNYSPILIIDFFAGNFVAGQFKVIEQIINFFRTYLQAFFKFSYGYVCFEMNKNLNKGFTLWKRFNGINSLSILFFLIAVFIFSNPILEFFKVKEFMLNELDIYLKIALLIPLFISCTLALEQLMFSLNKNKEYIRLTIASTIFNILALSVVMKFYGLAQAFLVLIFTEFILIVIYILILKPYFSRNKNQNEGVF